MNYWLDFSGNNSTSQALYKVNSSDYFFMAQKDTLSAGIATCCASSIPRAMHNIAYII